MIFHDGFKTNNFSVYQLLGKKVLEGAFHNEFTVIISPGNIALGQGWANFSAQGPQSQISSLRGPHSKLPRLFQN